MPARIRFRTEENRSFWERVTEGLEMQALWDQFRAEARASYALYAAEVDWEAIEREKKWKRPFRIIVAVFRAMLMKLSPARRVFLLLALVLFSLGNMGFRWGDVEVAMGLRGWAFVIVSLLLALELADRVTMKRDLEIAREIQQSLVPDKPPEVRGVDIAFTTRPANTIAGDYYDAFLRPPAESRGTERLLLVVADVAGKSVPAALLMASFQASLRALAALPSSLAELVAGLNRYACAHSLGGQRFTTAFLAEVDPGSRALHYICAGHNAPILRRATGECERLEAGGLPLGITPDAQYSCGNATLAPGDMLTVFTDGVVEAHDDKGEEYGEQHLLAWLGRTSAVSAADMLDELMADVHRFVGSARQHDDITCLILRVV